MSCLVVFGRAVLCHEATRAALFSLPPMTYVPPPILPFTLHLVYDVCVDGGIFLTNYISHTRSRSTDPGDR